MRVAVAAGAGTEGVAGEGGVGAPGGVPARAGSRVAVTETPAMPGVGEGELASNKQPDNSEVSSRSKQRCESRRERLC